MSRFEACHCPPASGGTAISDGEGARAAPTATPSGPNASRQSGLTLIEVLVAIAILAGAVGAVIVLMATQARGASALSDQALARIAAENAMVAVMIGEAEGTSPSGTEEIAGRAFAWEAARTRAPMPGLQAVTVTVRREDSEQVLAGLSTLTELREADN